MRVTVLPFVLAIALRATGCGGSPAPAPVEPAPPVAQEPGVVSWDILQREPVANEAVVKHILIGWRDLGEAYGGQIDPRAAARSEAQAQAAVTALLAKLQGGAPFEQLMAESSEDLSSAAYGKSFEVSPQAQLVIEFKQLAMRLNPGEIGVCQSNFGYHIIKRYQ
ncbi:MAG: peptidylprolyl isomerase [Kofleriaceae bacterium]